MRTSKISSKTTATEPHALTIEHHHLTLATCVTCPHDALMPNWIATPLPTKHLPPPQIPNRIATPLSLFHPHKLQLEIPIWDFPHRVTAACKQIESSQFENSLIHSPSPFPSLAPWPWLMMTHSPATAPHSISLTSLTASLPQQTHRPESTTSLTLQTEFQTQWVRVLLRDERFYLNREI